MTFWKRFRAGMKTDEYLLFCITMATDIAIFVGSYAVQGEIGGVWGGVARPNTVLPPTA